jgi:uncharacterized protein
MKKKYFSVIIAALLISLAMCAPAFAVVEKSSDFYVADYANVLSSDTKSKIINYNGSLEQQCDGAQVVVVTVDYLDGMNSSDYAMQLFNNWGIGSSQYNNGVLILLATQENKYWIQCGTGLDSTSLKSEIGGDISKFENYFDAGEYDKAVDYIFDDILKWFDSEYDSSLVSSGSSYGGTSQSVFGAGDLISLLIRLFFIYIFVSAIVKSVRRSYYARTGSWLPLFLFFGPCRPYWGYRPGPHPGRGFDDWNDHHNGGGFGGGGFGGGGFGGGSGGGFGGGMGHGGGGFGGGGFGRN